VTERGGNGEDDPPPAGRAAEMKTPEDEAPATGLAPVEGEPVAPLSREEVEALRKECDGLREQLLRRRADFENYRKRVERDRQSARAEAEAELLRGLIPTMDNLDRALSAAPSEASLREGVDLIRRELLALMEARGVIVDDPPRGRPFDPEIHQALSYEPARGVPDGTILEVFTKGYRLRDRLLRAALVKVAKGRESDDPEAIH